MSFVFAQYKNIEKTPKFDNIRPSRKKSTNPNNQSM